MSLDVDRFGRLHDFRHRPGDPPPPGDGGHSPDASRWGSRIRFEVNQPVGPKSGPLDSQTLIDIRTLEHTVPINLQIRFALADGNGNAILPFSSVWPLGTSSLNVIVRRSVDPLASITEDRYQLTGVAPGSQGATSSVFPGDVITTQKLSVVAEFQSGATPRQVWIEAIATPVDRQAFRDEIRGYPQTNVFAYPASNAAPAGFLVGRADRAQFIVVNTSTTGTLQLWFANFGSALPAVPSVLLPPGGANTYESPIGGFTGDVFGNWIGAADGNAYVTEGLYHLPPGQVSAY